MKTSALQQPLTKEDYKKFTEERSELEVDLLDEVLKSRSVAWRVAAGFFVMGLIGAGFGLMTEHRYSQPLPLNVMFWNDATKQMEQVSSLEAKATYGEANDKYWISQYVIHHESYDFYSAQADYDAVGLMSSSEVAEEYQKRYQGPKGLDKVLGDSESTRVKVISVLPDLEHGVATIRYTTTKKYRARPLAEPAEYWIATVGYTYDNILLNAEQRLINPFGFRILSWRTNAEAIGNVGG